MKNRLKIAFGLIAVALICIVIFQTYWTFNAYKLNKKKFDNSINIAMQRAIDDYKKTYLDSVRIATIKLLSPPITTIEVDTVNNQVDLHFTGKLKGSLPPFTMFHDVTLNSQVVIHFKGKFNGPLPQFTMSPAVFNYYKHKLHSTSSIAAILTEMSFNVPTLKEEIGFIKILNDPNTIRLFGSGGTVFVDKRNEAFDTVHKTIEVNSDHVRNMLADYNERALPKLRRALKNELHKLNISSPFDLQSSPVSLGITKQNLHYSESLVFFYKHPISFFYDSNVPALFLRVKFRQPQYAIMKRMLFILLLSFLLVIFTSYCFYYIISTIIQQKNLADLKDDFINNMTHELKTPIATISVAIEGLQNFNALNDPEKTQRYLETSKNELKRLNDLVTKVLDIATFENKEVELNKELIDADEIINEVIRSEKLKTTKTINIAFKNDTDKQLIFADKIHFRNAVGNLLDNAVKYSNEPVVISISAYIGENSFKISVKDKGIGIPPSHLSQIFNKFHRVPTGNVHAIKGSGLGLNYVKFIVEAHDGTIQVKSELNKGSEFIIAIPLKDE